MTQTHQIPGASSWPSVSVVIPCRNEIAHIDRLLDAMLAGQDYAGELEVIVADGMSTDGTRAVLEKWSRTDQRLSVIDNPVGIVPAGLNSAIRVARGDVIVRVDAHAELAHDYITECVRALTVSGAKNVGGPTRARGKTYFQVANAMAFHSPFASGGALFHDAEYEGDVDTVMFGCWYRSDLLEIGLFDEELARNQDDELNFRIVRNGGRIWQSPRIRFWYFPRPTIRQLFAQHRQYGYWKVRVAQKHHALAAVRQIVPFLTLLTAIALFAFGLFVKESRFVLGVLASAYVLASIAASVLACARWRSWRHLAILPIIFATYHLGYATGFAHGLFDFVIRRRGAGDWSARLTR
jgi:glycosyltransferase involved in cell wall biosynthesis